MSWYRALEEEREDEYWTFALVGHEPKSNPEGGNGLKSDFEGRRGVTPNKKLFVLF